MASPNQDYFAKYGLLLKIEKNNSIYSLVSNRLSKINLGLTIDTLLASLQTQGNNRLI